MVLGVLFNNNTNAFKNNEILHLAANFSLAITKAEDLIWLQNNHHKTMEEIQLSANKLQEGIAKAVASMFSKTVLKLINNSCSSYPTRASYSVQVDEFRNPMKNELKTQPCLKPVFEIISNTDANFVHLPS